MTMMENLWTKVFKVLILLEVISVRSYFPIISYHYLTKLADAPVPFLNSMYKVQFTGFRFGTFLYFQNHPT